MVAHRESVENGKTHYALLDGVPNGISGSDIALDQLRKLELKYTSELRARGISDHLTLGEEKHSLKAYVDNDWATDRLDRNLCQEVVYLCTDAKYTGGQGSSQHDVIGRGRTGSTECRDPGSTTVQTLKKVEVMEGQ
eukprot:4619095-Amphidinium_carterae.1